MLIYPKLSIFHVPRIQQPIRVRPEFYSSANCSTVLQFTLRHKHEWNFSSASSSTMFYSWSATAQQYPGKREEVIIIHSWSLDCSTPSFGADSSFRCALMMLKDWEEKKWISRKLYLLKSPGQTMPTTKQVARSNKSGRTVLGVSLRTPWMFSFELSLWYLYWLWLWLMMWRWVSCLHAVLVWNRNVEQTHTSTRHTAERERCCWSMTGLETRYPAWVSWVQWWSVGDSECKLTCWENDLLIDYCARVYAWRRCCWEQL